MGIWKGMKWVAREGTGLGASQRFGRLIFRGTGRGATRPGKAWGIWRQFMVSASAAVQSFGPSWARKNLRGRAVGVWVLVLAWVVPPLLLTLLTFHRAFHRSRGPAAPPVVRRSSGS